MKNKGMSAGMGAGTIGTSGRGMGAGAKSDHEGMKAGTLGTRGRGMGAAAGKGMKKGGKVKAKKMDGVAHKGKTKAKMIKMRMGGMCK